MATIKSPTVSSIPALYAFDSHTSTWQSYRDRINFYFKANHIESDDDKKALFLWSVGDTTYNLLESLISPRSLTENDTKFNDIIKLLDTHYDARKNIMTSTYDFYSCYQKSGQTFAEWKAELCEKLRHCAFTTSALHLKPQDRALRDMYVIGTKSTKVRQALLKEQDPDLETTEKIIQLAERLEQDVRHFASSNNLNDGTVAKLNYQKQRQQKPVIDSFKRDVFKACETCGSTKHHRSKCKYREFVCNFCKKHGHLERVCKQKDKQNLTKHISTIFKLNNAHRIEQYNKYSATISLLVNDHCTKFEIDTGTYHSIMSVKDWYFMGKPTLNPSNLKLKSYGGTSIQVKGECHVKVEYNNKIYNLSLIIIYGNGDPLLGLQWVNVLKLDLNTIIQSQNSIKCQVNKVHEVSKLQQLLKNYEQ